MKREEEKEVEKEEEEEEVKREEEEEQELEELRRQALAMIRGWGRVDREGGREGYFHTIGGQPRGWDLPEEDREEYESWEDMVVATYNDQAWDYWYRQGRPASYVWKDEGEIHPDNWDIVEEQMEGFPCDDLNFLL